MPDGSFLLFVCSDGSFLFLAGREAGDCSDGRRLLAARSVLSCYCSLLRCPCPQLRSDLSCGQSPSFLPSLPLSLPRTLPLRLSLPSLSLSLCLFLSPSLPTSLPVSRDLPQAPARARALSLSLSLLTHSTASLPLSLSQPLRRSFRGANQRWTHECVC